MTALLWMLLACRTTDKTPESPADDSSTDSDPQSCVLHVPRETEGVACTLLEMSDGSPLVWYGRDAGPGHPLQIRVRLREPELSEELNTQIEAWNAVLSERGVLLRYEVDDAAMELPCALDSLFDLPEQVVGVCLASAEEWSAAVPEANQNNAYYSRVNSPCDATIRGGLMMLNPEHAATWGERSLGKALGHMSSIVSIDDAGALLDNGWEGSAQPDAAVEGACVAYQYRELLE